MKINEKEYSQIVAKNLKRIMYEHGKSQTQVSKDLNINKSTLSCWMNGTRTPKMASIDMLCHYFNVSRAEIMEETPLTAVKAIRIPVYGKVVAGLPLSAIENIIDYEEIPSAWSGQYGALKVRGNSMEPRIKEGDVLIVRIQDWADSGDIVIAMVNGAEATVKKLIKHPDGITLQPFNPVYEPLYYSNEQIENMPVKIWGKVVENRQKF